MQEMESLQIRLNQTHNEIIKLLASGKAECYANLEWIKFTPGTVEQMNRLLARRNLLLELIDEQLGQNAGNQAQEEEKIDANPTGLVAEPDSGEGTLSE